MVTDGVNKTWPRDTPWASWTRESSAPFCRPNSIARCSIPGSLQMKTLTQSRSKGCAHHAGSVQAQAKNKHPRVLVRDFGKAQPCADGISQALVSSLPVSQCLLQHIRQPVRTRASPKAWRNAKRAAARRSLARAISQASTPALCASESACLRMPRAFKILQSQPCLLQAGFVTSIHCFLQCSLRSSLAPA